MYLISLPNVKKGVVREGECFTLLCYAIAHYTADDWEGKARMASVRDAAGIPLDEFDKEALKRCGQAQ